MGLVAFYVFLVQLGAVQQCATVTRELQMKCFVSCVVCTGYLLFQVLLVGIL